MNKQWREIYTDEPETWPKPGQWCEVVGFSEVHEMRFLSNLDSEDFVQMDCGFFNEFAGCIRPSSREYAHFGNFLWRPLKSSYTTTGITISGEEST